MQGANRWTETLAETMDRMSAEDAQREADWKKAVDKLSIAFEADHSGGYPECLQDLRPMGRLAVLRSLGYRVRSTYEINVALYGEPEEMHTYVRLSGGIVVDLTDGFVVRQRKEG